MTFGEPLLLGALGTGLRAWSGPGPGLRFTGGETLRWRVRSERGWHDPGTEVTWRRRLVDGLPVVEEAIRVPGGDLRVRSYGTASPAVAVEALNESRTAVAVAFDACGIGAAAPPAPSGLVLAPSGLVLALPRRPAEHREGPGTTTVVFPLAHRARLRIAVCPAPGPAAGWVEPAAPTVAARGWRALLTSTGMRVELDDVRAVAGIDLDRTQVLLDPDPGAHTAAALERWGFDDAARRAWERLRLRDRWAARRIGEPGPGPAGRLLRWRDRLLGEHGPRRRPGLALLPGWAPAPGRTVTVHEAPTRAGRCSFALRWHGTQPLLLWEVSGGSGPLRVTAPTLAPGWVSGQTSGEVLVRARRDAG